jgi:uncharacterized membrane protein
MEPEQLPQELGDQDRVLLVFGYLGPLALVSLIASRREFVKWHAKQGLVMWMALCVLYVVFGFVHFVLDRYFWAVFAEIFWAAMWLIVTGVVVGALVCVVRALEGERFKLPIIGDVTDRL